MARKRVYLSWLPALTDEKPIRDLLALLGKSGLGVEAGLWNRDLTKVGWTETAEPLAADPPDLWVLAGQAADFADPDLRLGLSLARLLVNAKSPRAVPLVLAGLDAPPVLADLPTPLRDAQALGPPLTAWGPRLVALAHAPARGDAGADDSRLSVIAHPALGVWFEVGPREPAQWQGSIFGVEGGEISHQGVGSVGMLPDRCILEYPSQGIQVDAGGRMFNCWAVQNGLDGTQSHFIRVTGKPTRILFGELPGADAAELAILQLM